MPDTPSPASFPRAVLFPVFVLSGISALIYQLVWQRMLLMIYGSNVESVAMVVAAFLMGLGIGSLVGGFISQREHLPLVLFSPPQNSAWVPMAWCRWRSSNGWAE